MRIFNIFRKRATVRLTDNNALNFLGGLQSRSGVRVNETSALGIPSFYRGISLLSDRVAGLDLFVLQHEEKGNSPDLEHAASRLLRVQANPYQSALVIKTTLQKDKLIHGNGYCLIERDNQAKPISLWRLDPTVTFPVMEKSVLYYATIIDGESVKLVPSDVIHIKRLGDSFVGFSILDLMRDMLGTSIASQRSEANFYSQGAQLNFCFKLPDGIQEPDVKRFREEWNKIHTGVKNSHNVLLIPPGFETQTLGLSPKDQLLIDMKKFSLIDVANLIGIPPSYLGAENTTSYSSLEADSKSLLDNSISSHLNDWESELSIKMLSEKEKDQDSHCIKFDRAKLEDTDNDKVVETATKKFHAGGISFNEYRKQISESPIEEEFADKFIMPSNMQFVEKIYNKKDEVAPVQETVREDEVMEDEVMEDDKTDDKLEAVTRSICDRLTTRVRKAIENKGTHNLLKAHLKTFEESLKPINERALKISKEYLEELQEELNSALPEQIQLRSETLYEVIA